MAANFHKHLKNILLVSLLNIVIISTLHATGLFAPLERWAYDSRMTTMREDKEISEDIALILIDDASLKALESSVGRWPWPRAVYAELLDFFALAPPKAVLFDITFSESQQNTDDDQALVAASAESPFVYHATRFVLDKQDESNQSLLNRPLPEQFRHVFSLTHRYGDTEISGLSGKLNNNFYLPFTNLWQNSAGMGVVEVNSDSDGIYRRARLLHRYQKDVFPSLSTSALFDQWEPSLISKQGNSLRIDQLRIPVDGDEKYLVNYYPSYPAYSISGILASIGQLQQGEEENLLISPLEFENKYVFIGASAAGLFDLKNTPMDSRLPGVMIHASITSNILQHDFLRMAPGWLTYVLIMVLVVITVAGIFLGKRGMAQPFMPLSLVALLFAVSYYLFGQNWVMDLASPALGIGSSWLSSFALLALTEGKEKQRFKNMMSQYLSPAVLNTVMDKHEEFAKAGIGSKERITVLFSDIRGFTNMSESLPPEKVVDILNHYFSEMTAAIFADKGTIDKFIGDAIMAYWGAPVKMDEHAFHATRAAMEMEKRLTHVNAWLTEQKYPTLAIGVGLHTGHAILGNIGSDTKLDYTIIGDTVNLASRMEGLTKQYQCCILITETTYADVEQQIICRLVDLVRVKGKQQPVRIYQPLGIIADMDEATCRQANAHASLAQQAFDAYLNKRWSEVIELLAGHKNDPIFQMLSERCQHYLLQPPAADWDGVFTMTSK